MAVPRAVGAVRKPVHALEAAITATIERWDMLAGVDRLGVAVSGGADSLALLAALHGLDLSVDLVPVHVHQHPLHQRPDVLRAFVERSFGLTTVVIEADTSVAAGELIAQGKAPCRACAPVRAEQLGEAATTLDLDALALGHHLDDAMATLLMNMFHGRGVDTMKPVARRRSHLAMPILRPMLLVAEREVKLASPAGDSGLFDCGMCTVHANERARAARFVSDMFERHEPSPLYAAELVGSLADRAPRSASSRGRRRPR